VRSDRLFAETEDAGSEDKNGNVYLAADQVLVFSPEGKLLGRN